MGRDMYTDRTAEDPPRRPRRTLRALVSVAIVAAVVGAAAGTIAAGSVATSTTAVSATPTDAASEPVGPSAPPPLPAGFPNAGQRYLADVTADGIADALLAREPGWTCEQGPTSAGTYTTTCRPADGRHMYNIDATIWHDDDAGERVTSVDGSCQVGRPGSRRCVSFFSDLAGVVLSGDPDAGERASRWARDNTPRDASTVFGGVRLTAELHPQRFTIVSEPAPG